MTNKEACSVLESAAIQLTGELASARCDSQALGIQRLLDAIDVAQEALKQSWYDAKVSTPSSNEDVLVYCKNGSKFVAYRSEPWRGEFDWFTRGPLGSSRKIARGRISHWRRLPADPNIN